jgi:hypothetical protein
MENSLYAVPNNSENRCVAVFSTLGISVEVLL